PPPAPEARRGGGAAMGGGAVWEGAAGAAGGGGARRHGARLGRAHDERAQPPHFLFQEADGVIELVAAEGIAAHELRKPIGLVNRSRTNRPHLVEGDGHSARRSLPRGL